MPITDSEKARRRALLKTHYDVENDHDMNGIMETFSPDCEMISARTRPGSGVVAVGLSFIPQAHGGTLLSGGKPAHYRAQCDRPLHAPGALAAVLTAPLAPPEAARVRVSPHEMQRTTYRSRLTPISFKRRKALVDVAIPERSL